MIAEPIYGHIRRTIPQILQLLHEAYGHMSLSQLFHLKANWQAQRWQPDENLITFMFNFQTGLTFLQQHQYAPPPGEVVNILQNAIDHVPALANPAKAMFFQQHPQIAEQTVANLMTILTQVYHTQYQKTTAASHNETVNQVTQDNQSINGLQGFIAATTQEIQQAQLSHAQIRQLQSAVMKTIQEFKLRSLPPEKTDRKQTQNRRPNNQQQNYLVDGTLPPDRCPYHPQSKTHTWDTCRCNPKNKKET